jgi:uncharacterized protein DUF3306
MEGTVLADDESTLGRWARRKTAARQPTTTDDSQGGTIAAPAPTAVPVETETQAAQDPDPNPNKATEEEIAALPDIDSLNESSDFSAFMKEGVPEELKSRALRKLWRVDPAFAHVDGLLDYDDDFTDAALVVEGLKTIYKVGKGMVTDEDETEEDAVADGETNTPADGETTVSTDEPDSETADPNSMAALDDDSHDALAVETAIESPKETTPTGKP